MRVRNVPKIHKRAVVEIDIQIARVATEVRCDPCNAKLRKELKAWRYIRNSVKAREGND